jgi:hypothetical protein|tara:strand:+ start:10012 stop:10203 length:192 start_codon:yes stop_codon:yes gene_type:complete
MAKEEKEEKETKKKQGDTYVVGQVPTQTADVIVNSTNTEEQYTVESALAKVLNNQEKLMKLLD